LQKVSIGPPSVLVSTPKIIGQRADGNPGRRPEGFPNSPGFAPSPWDRRVSELEYHLLLAKDLKLIKPKDHAALSQRAQVETHADRAASKAER
jgi:hypothetical protein